MSTQSPDGPVIGTLSVLRPEKRVGLLIEAFAQMREKRARLVIVGANSTAMANEPLAEAPRRATPWYSSARFFRHNDLGNWNSDGTGNLRACLSLMDGPGDTHVGRTRASVVVECEAG